MARRLRILLLIETSRGFGRMMLDGVADDTLAGREDCPRGRV